MNKNHIDSDLAQTGTALKRAAQRAREVAERTNTPLSFKIRAWHRDRHG